MPAQAVIGSKSTGHGCFAPTTLISGCASTVFVNGKAAAIVGAQFTLHVCGKVTHPASARRVVSGSGTVFINGKPAVRIGDPIACGDTVGQGSGNVFVG
jgi:uncharacterized Zn-binding protein involved in type VI secretion